MTEAIRIKEADFYQYAWNPRSSSRKYGVNIKQINKDAVTYKFTIKFRGSVDERRQNLENFYSVVETDLINETAGELHYILNVQTGKEEDYYIKGFIIASSTKVEGSSTNLTVELFCPNPFWISESFQAVFGIGSEAEEGAFLDYNRGYDYDYSRLMSASSVLNTNFVPTDFIITINGPVVNPKIYIDGHLYAVNCSLGTESQHLVINSVDKTILLYDNDGVTNLFDQRDRDSYIFDLIAPGDNPVSWNSSFTWEIKLIEKRSEPKWI